MSPYITIVFLTLLMMFQLRFKGLRTALMADEHFKFSVTQKFVAWSAALASAINVDALSSRMWLIGTCIYYYIGTVCYRHFIQFPFLSQIFRFMAEMKCLYKTTFFGHIISLASLLSLASFETKWESFMAVWGERNKI